MATRVTQLLLNEPKEHSVRFDADPKETDPVLSSIYVSKAHMGTPYPKAIKVTIEWEYDMSPLHE